MRGEEFLYFVIYLAVGAYFLNYPFNYFEVPDAIAQFSPWIIFVGGILIVLGGINHMRLASRRHNLRY